MPKKQKQLQFFILGGYLLGVLATMLLRGRLVFPRDWLEIAGLFLGGVLGWMMVGLDRIVYVLILHPEAQVSQYVRYHTKRRNYKEAWSLLERRQGELEKLTTRSALFQAAWVLLAIFAITSVASMFGKMLVMGLGLRVMVEEWSEYGKDKQGLKRKLFWQIKREVSNKELKQYMYIGAGVFVWLTWLLV
jgi:hypothetical protein